MVKQKIKPPQLPLYISNKNTNFLIRKKQMSLIGVLLLRTNGGNFKNVGQNLIMENPQCQPKAVCHEGPV